MSRCIPELEHPIVLAPMAGGPTTAALVAAVSNAGGLGFVAAGYLTPDALRDQISATRERTGAAFGVNIFSPSGAPADPALVEEFARRIAPRAQAAGVELGEPRFDDDHYSAKLEVVLDARPAVVSFTFGCPSAATVASLHDAEIEVWVTITTPAEARIARDAGADAVVAQGSEAGGHRGSFDDTDDTDDTTDGTDTGLVPLAELLHAVVDSFSDGVDAPLVIGAGGIMHGRDIAATLASGAHAAQLGTAFLLCPEAGTNLAQRAAVGGDRPTIVTRAFTGRRARGIVNAWTDAFDRGAPSAYPEIHHLTAPLRAHGRATDNANLVNLWAGTGHAQARALPAATLIAALVRERREIEAPR